MRLAGFLVASLLIFAAPSVAQEKSLADIARETREKKAQSSKPAKVITTDDFAGTPPQPVKSTDDPPEVVKRAGMALVQDAQHVCHSESSGNSGPGWVKSHVVEVAGAGREHIVFNDSSSKDGRLEYTVIDHHVYVKSGGNGWQPAEKAGWNDAQLSGMLVSAGIPDELKFGYSPEQLKFVQIDTIAGSPALLYESLLHTFDMDRTIRIWIGANDGLFRRSEMTTRGKNNSPSWQTKTTCSYGSAPQIQAPM